MMYLLRNLANYSEVSKRDMHYQTVWISDTFINLTSLKVHFWEEYWEYHKRVTFSSSKPRKRQMKFTGHISRREISFMYLRIINNKQKKRRHNDMREVLNCQENDNVSHTTCSVCSTLGSWKTRKLSYIFSVHST